MCATSLGPSCGAICVHTDPKKKSQALICKVPTPPGKSWKMGFGPGKSWNFLAYDVGDGHNDAGADANICAN